MKQKTIHSIAACRVGLLWTGQCLADEPLRDIFAPVQGQRGTSEILEREGRDGVARVGVLTYCTDIAPNAAALGLMAYQRGAKDHFHPLMNQERAALSRGRLTDRSSSALRTWSTCSNTLREERT